MTYVIIILIIVLVLTFASMFGVSDKIIAAGGNPTKVLAEIFNKKSNDKSNITELPDISKDNSIMHWRSACGILFGLTMLFFLTFWRRSGTPAVYIYPWIKYAFLAVLFSTIISFFILWKKEHDFARKNNQLESQDPTTKVGYFGRIFSGIIGLILLVVTIGFCLSFGFKGYFIILIVGGYSITFFWIAIKGREPY